MKKSAEKSLLSELKRQGAAALVGATFAFLRRNEISEKSIIDLTKQYRSGNTRRRNSSLYMELLHAYENMGVVMSTWFSDPKFLDASGNPAPLAIKGKETSITNLIRVSRAKVELDTALKLMRQSPSIRFNDEGEVIALRRVFVLRELELPRAAFVIERYLDTLACNASARKKGSPLLLERSSHASEVDLTSVAPMLRDIEGRGTAFMDALDGEIEERRLPRARARRKNVGELGVLVFAWTKPNTSLHRKSQRSLTADTSRKPKRTR